MQTAGPVVHIALIGFMGSGKSSVGRALSELLNWELVDLDELIVRDAGKSIAQIFRDSGETAFRARERAVLREALERGRATVIACGGGTFVDVAMRNSIGRAAKSVYLRTTAGTVMTRLSSNAARAQRPLLEGPDPDATVMRLLQQRGPSYEQADLVVDTDARSIDQLAHDIAKRLGLIEDAAAEVKAPAYVAAAGEAVQRLEVTARDMVYPVELRVKSGAWLVQELVRVCPGKRVAIISDTNVASLHAEPLVTAMQSAGKEATLHTFAAGEDSKSLATAAQLFDELMDAGLGRKDALLAVGGGVVGDITGFVASTYMRGIAYVQIPTTTLAAIDSSVGGKTGVNTRRGKNLVGTFYPPCAVLAAAAYLKTQDKRGHAAGLVEAVKIAATHDAALFESILENAEALVRLEPEITLRVIGRAVELKAGVVSRDEHEHGERAVLNFGHTIGHAIETGEAYRLLHGEAVGLGMLAEAEWAESQNLCADVSAQLRQALSALNMPIDWRRAKLSVEALGLDKKRVGADVSLPVVPRIGEFSLQQVPMATLVAFATQRNSA